MNDLGRAAWNYFVIRCGHCKGSLAALQATRGDDDAGGAEGRTGKIKTNCGRRSRNAGKTTGSDTMYPSGAWRGYWQQEIFGRQTMHDLTLRFKGGRIDGEGYDCIGY